MRKLRGEVLLLVGLAISGCRQPHEPSHAQSDAAAAPTSAPVPPPPQAPSFSVQYQLPDGGWNDLPPGMDSRPTIQPTAALKVTTNVPLQNYRVRVLDEADRVVPSDDDIDHPDAALEYRMLLSSPLKSGHRYAVVVDAQNGPSFLDSEGRPQPDQRFEFQIAGEREKPTPSPKRRKRRHH